MKILPLGWGLLQSAFQQVNELLQDLASQAGHKGTAVDQRKNGFSIETDYLTTRGADDSNARGQVAVRLRFRQVSPSAIDRVKDNRHSTGRHQSTRLFPDQHGSGIDRGPPAPQPL
jgi:hypothetical protein